MKKQALHISFSYLPLSNIDILYKVHLTLSATYTFM